jgi:hypothetical protein
MKLRIMLIMLYALALVMQFNMLSRITTGWFTNTLLGTVTPLAPYMEPWFDVNGLVTLLREVMVSIIVLVGIVMVILLLIHAALSLS